MLNSALHFHPPNLVSSLLSECFRTPEILRFAPSFSIVGCVIYWQILHKNSVSNGLLTLRGVIVGFCCWYPALSDRVQSKHRQSLPDRRISYEYTAPQTRRPMLISAYHWTDRISERILCQNVCVCTVRRRRSSGRATLTSTYVQWKPLHMQWWKRVELIFSCNL